MIVMLLLLSLSMNDYIDSIRFDSIRFYIHFVNFLRHDTTHITIQELVTYSDDEQYELARTHSLIISILLPLIHSFIRLKERMNESNQSIVVVAA